MEHFLIFILCIYLAWGWNRISTSFLPQSNFCFSSRQRPTTSLFSATEDFTNYVKSLNVSKAKVIDLITLWNHATEEQTKQSYEEQRKLIEHYLEKQSTLKEYYLEQQSSFKVDIALSEARLIQISKDLLESKGQCTSRGLFEYYLKAVHQELKLKGKFNASVACKAIGKLYRL